MRTVRTDATRTPPTTPVTPMAPTTATRTVRTTRATATARITESPTAPTKPDLTFAGLAGEDFLTRVWGRTFAVLPGSRGRFHSLLPWSEVNGMLQKQRLEPPRLRLV